MSCEVESSRLDGELAIDQRSRCGRLREDQGEMTTKPEKFAEFHVRLSEESADELRRRAAEVGATPSSYLRALVDRALIAERKGKVIV